MSFLDRYEYADPDDPFLLATRGSTFGGPEDQEDNGLFAFGGGSILPDGSINPENYAALPEEWYNEDLVKPGQKFKVTNPETGITSIVVARDKGPSAPGRGIDLAPHAMLELGADTDQPLIIDLRPISDEEEKVIQPFALDSGPPDMSLSDITPSPEVQPPDPSEVFDPARAGLSALTAIGSKEPEIAVTPAPSGFTPNQSIIADAEASYKSKSDPNDDIPDIIETRKDGSKVFEDGTIVYPNGVVELKVGEEYERIVPGAKSPRRIKKESKGRPDLGLMKEARELNIDVGDKDAATVHREIIEKRNAMGILSPAQQQAASSLLTKMNGDVAYKDVQNIKQGYLSVMDGALTGTSAGDLAMINGYQRMIDPGATVREGDVKLIQSAQGVLQKIANLPAVLAGQAQLTPEMRRQIKAMADTVYKTRVMNFERSSGKKFRELSKKFNLPEDTLDLNFGVEINEETPSSATQQQAVVTPSPATNQAATPARGSASPSDEEAYRDAMEIINDVQASADEKQAAEAVIANMRTRKLIP